MLRTCFTACGIVLFAGLSAAAEPAVERLAVDLLVVGGSESAVSAAVQGARLGVKSIALVNDIDWLGGQFSAEGVGAIDEWTLYRGQRAIFPRSGMFLEMMERLEARMRAKYGLPRPGNSFCAWTTCEPRDAERQFREWLAPYLVDGGGPVTLREQFELERVLVDSATVVGAEFVSPRGRLVVRARLTIDASDWGDVIRRSGAAYLAGPDLRERFGEPSAPTDAVAVQPNEMNPITYCLVLRESDEPATIERPPHYDERRYFGTTTATRSEYDALGWPRGTMRPFAPAWRDSTMARGPYGEAPTVYTHRRLVDRRHNKLSAGTESVLVNWPLQDYPTYDFPRHVVVRLEADERGASRKNLVDMSPRQRQIVFDDAKCHALGMLYHLQTTVAGREPNQPVSFRGLRLTDEFDTPDRLPPKPYVREGLRLVAAYVLREQDVRDTDGVQSWARSMVPDSAFGFQFNIDFHPTKRIFLANDDRGPWAHIHSALRNWGTHTDRAGFPLRGLVPRATDGLIGAGKNLGVTSIVQSAVRIHPHGMQAGQAAATLAAVCLRENLSPRRVVRRGSLVRCIQSTLIEPPPDRFVDKRPPGALLWPYQDLPTDAAHFVAANQLAVRGILPGKPGLQDFDDGRPVTRREFARAVARACLASGLRSEWAVPGADGPAFSDVPASDEDFAAIESLRAWSVVASSKTFAPDEPARVDWARAACERLSWKWPEADVRPTDSDSVSRITLALMLWSAVKDRPDLSLPDDDSLPSPERDTDGDGTPDLDDPLPHDRDNDNVPTRLDPDERTKATVGK